MGEVERGGDADRRQRGKERDQRDSPGHVSGSPDSANMTI